MMSSEDKRGIDSKPALGKVPLDLPFTKVAVALKGGAMDFPWELSSPCPSLPNHIYMTPSCFNPHFPTQKGSCLASLILPPLSLSLSSLRDNESTWLGLATLWPVLVTIIDGKGSAFTEMRAVDTINHLSNRWGKKNHYKKLKWKKDVYNMDNLPSGVHSESLLSLCIKSFIHSLSF